MLLETQQGIAQFDEALGAERVGPGVVFSIVERDQSKSSLSPGEWNVSNVAVGDDLVLGVRYQRGEIDTVILCHRALGHYFAPL